jgi:hypothetical protein
MEKMRTTTKGDVHRKSIKQAGKGDDTAMVTITKGEIR